MRLRLDKDNAEILIDTRIYSAPVIQKCFYWYTADYSVNIDRVDDNTMAVKLISKYHQDIDPIQMEQRILQDLNDFGLREIVREETKVIRSLIVAKAFANFEDDKDVFSSEDVADPLGFNIGS